VTGWRDRAGLLLAVLLAGVALPPSAAYGEDRDRLPAEVLFRFADQEIFESSGLVDDDRVVYTVNDSGADAVLYGVDPATGRTVTRTTYADEARDTEALAPGPGHTVWVGDIGDNRESRDDVTVHRVQPVDGDRTGVAYSLRYPDGAHDAETLLAHPRTGRLFVVSKSVFGGTVYAAPSRLRGGDGANRLRPFAEVAGLVTDGAFLPDGKRVVLRTYGTASVYTFPGFELLGTVRLPRQRQGEAVSVSPSGRVLLSSEGVDAPVLRVVLLADLLEADQPPATPPGPEPATPARSSRANEPEPRSAGDWALVALAAAGVGGLGYLAIRGSRLRGPRRR
jgi:hypothetical protein